MAEAFPTPFLARMRRRLGSEAGPFERALAEPPTVGLRVDTPTLTAAASTRLSGQLAITVSGRVLDGAKRARGAIHSAYPKGLRLR